jgi:plasmid stabilization system protein ParE
MPPVKFAPSAVRDLQRLRQFLESKNPVAAQRSAKAIIHAVQVLGQQPHIGRMIEHMPDGFREWVIDFGDSGYVARYQIGNDAITILAVRHQKEVGF